VSSDPRNTEGLGALLGVIARALENEHSRAELKKDPKSVLHEAGLHLDDNVEVKLHENSRTELHIVLPAPLEDLDGDTTRHLINMWPV
jgi:nitrile hydratase alpha subunit